MNERSSIQLTALLMAHGLSGSAQGQNASSLSALPETTNAATSLPDIVVKEQQSPAYKPDALFSPKLPEALRDLPQTVNVVPRAVIEDQGATTLRDVLRNVPGISFQAGEGGVPAGDQLSIRGFSARTDLFIDGVRDIGGYTRDAFNIEQVEVTKGPNSAYSGRGSTGGAVNMVSKSPKAAPAYGADLSYGSDSYSRATVDVNQPMTGIPLKGTSFRLNGVFHDQDFAGRDEIHDQRWGLAPSLAFGLGTDTRVILSYLHLQEDNLAGYGLPFVSNSNNPYGGPSAVGKIAPLPFHSFLGLKDRDYEHVFNDIGTARIEHDFSEDISLRNQTRYGRTYRDSIITAPRIVNNPAPDPVFGPNTPELGHSVPGPAGINYGLNHEMQSRDQTDEVIANQTDLTTLFDTWKWSHDLVNSLEYYHETEVNYLRSATAGTPFPLPAQTSNPLNPSSQDLFHPVFRTGARNEATSDAIGFSAFDTIHLTEKWILTAGARVDSFDVTYRQSATNGVRTRFERSDLEPTWRSGLVFKPRPNGSIYFGYGTSFNPSAEGLTLATNNVSLAPELSQSFELGTKWDLFDQRLSVSAALFRTDKDNYRNTDPVTSIVSTTGEVRVQGIEFGLSGQITRAWSVYGGYAFMESEILRSKTVTTYNGVRIPEEGHTLSNTPEQTATLWTTYALTPRLSLGTGVQFVDKRFSNNIETSSVPGYWLQDALLAWKANEHFSFRLNAYNLWDKEYIDRVGGGHSIPGTGRTVILTASLKF
ncbi:MAG: TonB-dependent siderophore receptor [Verrucomicrobiota bacterium]